MFKRLCFEYRNRDFLHGKHDMTNRVLASFATKKLEMMNHTRVGCFAPPFDLAAYPLRLKRVKSVLNARITCCKAPCEEPPGLARWC